jgi:hypothetical protein
MFRLSKAFAVTLIPVWTLLAVLGAARQSAAAERVYFPAYENVTDVLVAHIMAEDERIDISSWYLSEHSVSIALANRFAAGVEIRLMGDRGAIFEADAHTKTEFYFLANEGIPIRLRVHPNYFPEINHWKMALFKEQGIVAFGSGNFAPTELAPVNATNYSDETILFTDDAELVGAFKTRFDVMWNDTTPEAGSRFGPGPYFKDWYDACASEPTGNCADFATRYPNPAPMIVNTARLEGDNPTPPDLIWGQGQEFNSRIVQEINNEFTRVDLLTYRLETDDITNAILAKHQAGIPVRVIIDRAQYTNIIWPEYWLTHANIDKLWAAGVPIKQNKHDGVMHMKTLVTSNYASNASSNIGPNWQRDHNYFVPKATKTALYQSIANRANQMWNDTVGFQPLVLTPPRAADLVSPATSATGVATNVSLVWNRAAWAVSYDVYLGTSQTNMTLVENVPAQMVLDPPLTYSWTPPSALQGGTTYFWKVVSRTNATELAPNMIATSEIRSFATAGTAGPPAAPASPSPSTGSTGVGITPTLGWSAGAAGTTFNVAFGPANPPPPVVTGLSTPTYTPGTLSPNTTYFWKVTAVSTGGSTAGPLWSFTTGTSGGGTPNEVVIYASDVTAPNIHGAWSKVADASAAAGFKLSNTDAAGPTVDPAQPAPDDFFETSFQAVGSTRYRVWLRLRAIGNSKFNDSVFVQFSDSTTSGGTAIYRIGTTSGLLVNLATDSTGSSNVNWGWQRNAYWLADTGDVWFQNSGTHTLRVQVREDGVEIDQIVLSPVTYVNNSPGQLSNDNTIVAKPGATQPPTAPGSPSPANSATGVATTPTLTWSAAGATTYDVRFGTSPTPPQVTTNQSAASYSPPSALLNNTTYYWQIIARNGAGTTNGPVWSFTTAAAAVTCQDAVTLGYSGGTLNIGFTVATPVAANWNVWLYALNTLVPLWSAPLPVVLPAVSFSVPIPNFPQVGTVYIFTTLGPGTTVSCYDVKGINTGP